MTCRKPCKSCPWTNDNKSLELMLNSLRNLVKKIISVIQ